MKPKHVPQRTCIGCRAKKPQRELSRVGKGRGAYLCQDSVECFELAMKKNAFSRALKRELTNDEKETIRKKILRN